MPRFMMVYKGEATDMSDMSAEQVQEVMAKWGAWMAQVGDSLIDLGTPFGPGSSLLDDGNSGAAASLTGYSVVEAPSMDEALHLADGHPFLSEGKGNYAIDIFELMPVPIPD